MSNSDSSGLKRLHPRLRERLKASQEAEKHQMGLFDVPSEALSVATAPSSELRSPTAELLSPSSELPSPSVCEESSVPFLVEPEAPKTSQIYSVTEIANEIKSSLRRSFGTLSIQGEIADFKGVHRNGHLYCSLKDETSQIRMVMWKQFLSKVPFEVKGGLEVIVSGKLDFYGGSGSLQINVERMEPVGIGALQLKFEQLKAKLQSEGLFDESRKRPIKTLNWRVGIVTGKSTAALQDILRVFSVRFPLIEVFVFQTSVQGEKAPAEIVSAIRRANAWSATQAKGLDVLIVGRGGGSYEDLFCFNDEGVARAIVASKIPVVSAVGHEIDFTIADFVADRRAATPSNAAEMTSPDRQEWLRRLEDLREFFPNRVEDLIRARQEKLDYLTDRLVAAAPHKKLQFEKELLQQRRARLERSMQARLEHVRKQLAQRAAVLEALSPLKVLERGFSLARDASGRTLKKVSQLQVGQDFSLQLVDGWAEAQIKTLHKKDS
jgi:exodeoxyribonuclease VII large subunit